MGDAAPTVDKKTGLRFGFINHKLCKEKGVLQNTPFSKLGFIVQSPSWLPLWGNCQKSLIFD